MGYLSEFEQDVFISYAHQDDDCIPPEAKGWVTELHENLEKLLFRFLGSEPKIWRDCDIHNFEDFSKKISGKLASTAIFLAIISPVFFQREWTRRELEEFTKHAERKLGIRVGEDKPRIFKVERIPVDRDELPEQLQGTGSYKFYKELERRVDEFRPLMGGEYYKAYVTALSELAWDIKALLKEMKKQKKAGEPSGLTVYLAEPAPDLQGEAREVRRDLIERGYTVLPPGDLPRGDPVEKVRSWLKVSDLSVHMVGSEYGTVAAGGTTSLPRLQYDLAVERSAADPAFARLVWMPGGVAPFDDRQKQFIHNLQEGPAGAHARCDVLQMKLEDLKETLQDKLKEIREHRDKPPAPNKTSEHPRVYLVCDRLDQVDPNAGHLLALKDFLFDQGFDPVLPPEFEDEARALQEHDNNFKLCDACLIYYGQGSEKWIQTKLNDVLRAPALRSQPMRASAVYLAPPDAQTKELIKTHELKLRGADPFSADVLTPFVTRVRGN